ncbi:hypothetical protein C8R44DRAFT_822699 [Mycena epipterygia]|nr:hypothetical protein C8R44DRAFT_822699 [Mycena epipterygia]
MATISSALLLGHLITAAEENIARIESQIKDLMCLRDRERGLITALRLVIAPIRKLSSELLVQIFLHSLSSFRPSIKDALKIPMNGIRKITSVSV